MTLDDPALHDALTRCELTSDQLASDARLGWLWHATDPTYGSEDLLISARDQTAAAYIARRTWGASPPRTPVIEQVSAPPRGRRRGAS